MGVDDFFVFAVGNDLALDQASAASQLGIPIVDLTLGLHEFCSCFFPDGYHGANQGTGGINVGFGGLELDAEWLFHEFDQDCAFVDMGVVFDEDLGDAARNFGCYPRNVGFYLALLS